jgi:4-amino-4-deoxy-L-arabinose transferase-like glycosyltransferase
MTATTQETLRAAPRARWRARSLPLPRPELAALLVLAGALNLWALSTNGWANEYYSGAVRSMAASWHAFLYGSLDAAGVMTVDKPPLALMVQALSVRAFGWSSPSLLVPQALMGVASVALVYDLVARRFGRAGGFVGGAVLALTPIAVAVSRHNNPDALLVLCVVGAAWAVVRGLEGGRVRWMVLAGVFVGLGFSTKMGAALLVVPALAVAWAWAAPVRRVRGLLGGGLAMIVAGGAWPLLVALTPASSRPWISGTSDNSIWSLIVGYNGLGRLDGQAGGPGGATGGPGGGAGGVFGGDAGVFRLLNAALGGQAGWLIGFALVAGVALVVSSRLRRRDPVTGWVLAVGGSALTAAVAFSTASGIFHPYYVSELAPFVAALVGAGVVRFASGDMIARVAGPLAIGLGVVAELKILADNEGSLTWLPPVLVVVGVVAAGALAFGPDAKTRNAALATALSTLLIAPATWSVQTLGHATSGTFPAGGPASAAMGGPGGGGRGGMGGPPPGLNGAGGFAPGGAAPGADGTGTVPGAGGTGTAPGAGGSANGGTAPGAGGFGGPGGGGMFGGNSASLTTALAYIKANGGGTLAVSSQSTAAAAITDSGADIVGIGGFSGRESEVSVSWLADQVSQGNIRWVLADSSGGGGLRDDGRTGSSTAMAAAAEVGTPVDVDGVTLYDLQGKAAALAALA